MQQIHIAQVIVPENRQRREFAPKQIIELMESIQSKGLFHAPVFRQTEEGYVLVAGERRLKAIMELLSIGDTIRYNGEECDADNLPVTLLTDLSDFGYREAELEENTRRVDLSWQELAAAQSELHALRCEQATALGEQQTIRKTAAEIIGLDLSVDPDISLGGTPKQISDSLILAQHMADPEVAKAKSSKEALKVVEKKARQQHMQMLADRFDSEMLASPHEILEGDSVALLQSLPASTFTCLLTDPPYGINADQFGEQSDQGHNYADSEEYFNQLTLSLAKESFRVCTAKAHAYVFCDPRRFNFLSQAFAAEGWEVWPIPLIWKKSTGMLPRPEHAPRRTYEAIMYAIKGSKTVHLVKGDVIDCPSVRDLVHGAQKPVELYMDLLSRSCAPGDAVLDPFAGSGTIFPAATSMRLKATGIELNAANVAICKTRMSDDTLNIDLGE